LVKKLMHACAVSWINVLFAHGTISALEELPQFLTEVRRGKPPSAELLAEMHARYERIGHSPLLEHTRQQARDLEQRSGRETRVAMRLWHPKLAEVVSDLTSLDKICLIPMAPFSVEVYRAAAEQQLAQLPAARRPQLRAVAPWGAHPRLIDAYVAGIVETINESVPVEQRAQVPVILTAHSLPSAVIRGGDQYQQQFLATAALVAARLPQPVTTCFQSQGADGGEWLGPGLSEGLKDCATRGAGPVVVAPIGFFAEHVETLYDLDVEARAQAQALGLRLLRVPTVHGDPGLLDALCDAAEQAIHGSTHSH